MLFRLAACAALMFTLGAGQTVAASLPKVAVSDLTYEEKIREHFHVIAAHDKSSLKASGSMRERERESDRSASYSASTRSAVDARSESSYFEMKGEFTRIELGELRRFTADIKGEMLKSKGFRLMQGKPYTGKKTSEAIYDIIARIKKGDYKGADYVLFGTVSSLEFRDESQPVIGSNATSYFISLDLVADFSLINTKTFEIKAAFSAAGEGKDMRLSTGGERIQLSQAKVIRAVSQSLGEDVATQLDEQFGRLPGGDHAYEGESHHSTTVERSREEKVIIYR